MASYQDAATSTATGANGVTYSYVVLLGGAQFLWYERYPLRHSLIHRQLHY
jgi:hypothetical protein